MVIFLFYSYLLFNIVPVFVDIIVAVIFFILAFNIYFGLIVFVTMALYLGKYLYNKVELLISGHYEIKMYLCRG